MKKILLLFSTAITMMLASGQKTAVDLLVFNAHIYTVDEDFSIRNAMAIKDGKIISIGSTANIRQDFEAPETLDVQGKYIYPGFIDAHAHFLAYGLGLQSVDLTGTRSWQECLDRLQAYANTHKEGWLIGHGWDQNDWQVKRFPDRAQLDALFPDRPVFLHRVDGHAAIANEKALGALTPGTSVAGGELETSNGRLTGMLIDNAVGLVNATVPEPSLMQKFDALLNAQANCFAVGLTTIDDCGLQYGDALMLETLQKTKELKMRMYVMLSDNPENFASIFRRKMIKTDRLNVRAFKVYADGALGSRGACLLAPYSDRPDSRGFLLSSREHLDSVAAVIYKHGFQMCTHAIGDSANRLMLNIYAKYLKGKNRLRWRIEHAQVVNQSDFKHFGQNSIVPSVQPTHATSDMYWAKDRLGSKRLAGAYAYKELLQQNGWLPLGTDFPVEDINPLKTFYAACVRKDAKGFPPGGFQVQNALSRKDALRGMTIWAAMANFEEKEKGSLEEGKFADFVILDTDLLQVAPAGILKASVLKTYLNGEMVYEKK